MSHFLHHHQKHLLSPHHLWVYPNQTTIFFHINRIDTSIVALYTDFPVRYRININKLNRICAWVAIAITPPATMITVIQFFLGDDILDGMSQGKAAYKT